MCQPHPLSTPVYVVKRFPSLLSVIQRELSNNSLLILATGTKVLCKGTILTGYVVDESFVKLHPVKSSSVVIGRLEQANATDVRALVVAAGYSSVFIYYR